MATPALTAAELLDERWCTQKQYDGSDDFGDGTYTPSFVSDPEPARIVPYLDIDTQTWLKDRGERLPTEDELR